MGGGDGGRERVRNKGTERERETSQDPSGSHLEDSNAISFV